MNILLIIYLVSVVATLTYILKGYYKDWKNGFDITSHGVAALLFVSFAPILNTLFILHQVNIKDWIVIKGKER